MSNVINTKTRLNINNKDKLKDAQTKNTLVMSSAKRTTKWSGEMTILTMRITTPLTMLHVIFAIGTWSKLAQTGSMISIITAESVRLILAKDVPSQLSLQQQFNLFNQNLRCHHNQSPMESTRDRILTRKSINTTEMMDFKYFKSEERNPKRD